jgi:hypothetical protein
MGMAPGHAHDRRHRNFIGLATTQLTFFLLQTLFKRNLTDLVRLFSVIVGWLPYCLPHSVYEAEADYSSHRAFLCGDDNHG